MNKVVEFHLESRAIREVEFSGFRMSEDPSAIYWINLDKADAETTRRVLGELGVGEEETHLLVDPDALPGMYEGESHLLVLLEYWNPVHGHEKDPVKYGFFMTERFVATVSPEMVPSLKHLDQTYRREFRFAKSTGFMLFLILDYHVDDFVDMLRPLDTQCEHIDERIFERFEPDINKSILELKRRVLLFKRVTIYTRDILMRLSGRRIPVVSEACRQSLADVFNHASVLVQSLESLRDMVSSSLDSYMSVLAQRLNEIMKVLTLFSLAILPMTLVAGIYGMNFDTIPELHWPFGYLWALALMMGAGGLFIVFFKRKGWV